MHWDDIKDNAIDFVDKHRNDSYEAGEASRFMEDFVDVFKENNSLSLLREYPVKVYEKKLKKETVKKIDGLMKGKVLIEMKSKGKSLDRAYTQSLKYVENLSKKEKPEQIIVSDFVLMRVYDIGSSEYIEFRVAELYNNLEIFELLADKKFESDSLGVPVDEEAVKEMVSIHGALSRYGYKGNDLEEYLVRLLFCMFAEDTELFKRDQFLNYIRATKKDGSDLAQKIGQLFEVLDTPEDKRTLKSDSPLTHFPYVNGGLFRSKLSLPEKPFTAYMRDSIIDACTRDWSKISPAIFGTMFQMVMEDKGRRNLGAHYTSEANVKKVINPLFLDKLWLEFENAKGSRKKLKELQHKISNLQFLDPACGCGNFLVITYQELRKIDTEIIRLTETDTNMVLLEAVKGVKLSQFTGIEISKFPCQVAKVSMILAERLMDMDLRKQLGVEKNMLPLSDSANIINENALRVEWCSLSERPFDYIMGNPPYVGKNNQTAMQIKDMKLVCDAGIKYRKLDYICSWFFKAAEYCTYHEESEVGFVSTNSICLGEQLPVLWAELYNKYDIRINFAYKSFMWDAKAKGDANVCCIIIGFSNKYSERKNKLLYSFGNYSGPAFVEKVKNINAYLTPIDNNAIVTESSKPFSGVKKMTLGNKTYEGRNLYVSEEEYKEFKLKYLEDLKYVKRLVNADTLLSNKVKYCFWLVDVDPDEIENDFICYRMEQCREFRLQQTWDVTIQAADTPHLFLGKRNPKSFIAIPRHMSENRDYIPMSVFDDGYIATDRLYVIENVGLYEFAILSSKMHMIWCKYTSGGLGHGLRYAQKLTYNTFPWPENVTRDKKKQIEQLAQNILDIRKRHPSMCLAELYNIDTMPSDLKQAHEYLDKAVEELYIGKRRKFGNDDARLAWLLKMYEKLVSEP